MTTKGTEGKQQANQSVQSVSEVLREAWSKIPHAPDMGDFSGKCGLVLVLAGAAWLGVAPFFIALGVVLILVSVLKGLR